MSFVKLGTVLRIVVRRAEGKARLCKAANDNSAWPAPEWMTSGVPDRERDSSERGVLSRKSPTSTHRSPTVGESAGPKDRNGSIGTDAALPHGSGKRDR